MSNIYGLLDTIYAIFIPKLIGSGFKVQGLQPIETAQNIDRNSECLP